jgi:hypothetical protein
MSELTRRSFFRGVIAAAASTQLIVEASASEVAQFSKGNIIEGQALEKGKPTSHEAMIYIKTADERYVPYGFVTDLEMEREMLDVSMWGETVRRYHPGTYRWEGRFQGYGPLVRDYTPEGAHFNGYPLTIKWPSQDWDRYLYKEYPDYRRG